MRVKLYDLKETVIECRNCGNQTRKLLQVGVDVGIATLIVKLAAQNRYQRLVLSTGDGDFEDAIAFAKEELHKEIILCGFHDSISPDLQSYADSVIWLNDHWEKIQRA
jgi:nijmegen breakage syndrome protein 1